MSGYRTDIEAHAGPITERLLDGSLWLQVRVRMFDAGVEHPQPDVVCDLRPGEARDLAFCLLARAEHADQLSSMRHSAGIHAGGRPPHAGHLQPPKHGEEQQA
jgi:hypothetical protein